MNEPIWLPKEVVLAVQEQLLERFGGMPGSRDEGLLDSALAKSLHLHASGAPKLTELAAGAIDAAEYAAWLDRSCAPDPATKGPKPPAQKRGRKQ